MKKNFIEPREKATKETVAKLQDFGVNLFFLIGMIAGITTIVFLILRAFGKTLF